LENLVRLSIREPSVECLLPSPSPLADLQERLHDQHLLIMLFNEPPIEE
jgi:hypothetical protein